MKKSFKLEPAQSIKNESKDAILHIINTAIIAVTPKKSSEGLSFISDRDLGDEDAHDLFES